MPSKYVSFALFLIIIVFSILASVPVHDVEYANTKRGYQVIRVINLTAYKLDCELDQGNRIDRFYVYGNQASRWYRITEEDHEVYCYEL